MRFKNALKLTISVAIIALVLTALPAGSTLQQVIKELKNTDVLLIDPGHGGFDGGAESVDGVPEKDINLAIALLVAEEAERAGFETVLTREDDRTLGDDEIGTIRSRKTRDLRARKKIIDEIAPYAVVSIHLNSFTQDRSVHGAQVFYAGGDEEDINVRESKALAEKIRENLISGLNDGTDRIVLPKSDVRLLKNVSCPTVIVECGFLSNEKEATLLQNQDYRKKIAVCIYKGIEEYSGKKNVQMPRIVDNT
ncbi:MAG: N-acetylmuramoyl-L-alanine amidase [Eubacteriales bacterium]|nr:N-acetylmuramoyl-L-alanine amidase [Eubacteriales bacterium]MDD4390290.1 N-acetylmuramoyl-L-alanine amidase [Eubacteriales bacterium]